MDKVLSVENASVPLFISLLHEYNKISPSTLRKITFRTIFIRKVIFELSLNKLFINEKIHFVFHYLN